MAKLAALAASPVAFTDPDSGSQLSIPLSLIYFEDGTAKLTTPAGMSSSTSDAISNWLAALDREGILAPDTQAPPVPAMVISANTPGSAGNAIQIAITNVRPKPTDVGKTILDATVTETNIYPLLTPARLKAVLGTPAATGEKPGLVFVSSAAAPGQPKNGDYPMAGDPATVDILKSNGSPGAFSLTSRAGGGDAALTAVSISSADDASQPGTFTLTAVWTKSAVGIEASDLQTTYAYEITVAPPPGGPLAVPAPGTYVLSGGAEAQAATKAAATIPASS